MTAPAMLLPLVAGGAAGVYEGDEAADPAVAEAFLAFLTQSAPPVEPIVPAPMPAPVLDDLIAALQGHSDLPAPVVPEAPPALSTPVAPMPPAAPVTGAPVAVAPKAPVVTPAPAPNPEIEVARVLSLMPSHRARVTEPVAPKAPKTPKATEVARPVISSNTPMARTLAPETRETEPATAPDAPLSPVLHPAPPAELFAALAPTTMVTLPTLRETPPSSPAPIANQSLPVMTIPTETPTAAPASQPVVEAAEPTSPPAPVVLPDSPVLPMGSMEREDVTPAPEGTTHAAPKGDVLSLRAAILILDSLGGPRERTRPARPEPAPKISGSTPVKATIIAGEAEQVAPQRPVISRETPRPAASHATSVTQEHETPAGPLPVQPAPDDRAVARSEPAEDKTRRDAAPTQKLSEATRPAASPVLPQNPSEGIRVGGASPTFVESRQDVATAGTPAPAQTAETRTPVPAPRQVTIELEGPTSDPTRIRVAVFGTTVRATILGEAGQSGRLSEYTGELRQALEDRGFRTASVAVRTIGDTPVAAPAPTSGGRSGSEPEQRPGSRRQDLSEYRQNQHTHDRSRQQRRPEPEEE